MESLWLLLSHQGILFFRGTVLWGFIEQGKAELPWGGDVCISCQGGLVEARMKENTADLGLVYLGLAHARQYLLRAGPWQETQKGEAIWHQGVCGGC